MSGKTLKANIIIGGSISASLKSAFATTESSLKGIGREVGDLTRKQALLGRSIETFGRMGKNIDGLRSRYASVTSGLDRMRKAQERLNLAQARHARLTSVAGKMQSAGVTASIGGAVVIGASMSSIHEAKAYQSEQGRLRALGMGEATNKEAFKFAKDMKTVGTSQLENLTIVRDALSVFSDLHHTKMAAPTLAKMKYVNEGLFGAENGANNERAFMDMLKVIELRGGTKSGAEFEKQANMVQRVISATGGRVGGEEWRNVIQRGGLAAQGMRDDAFFYQLEPLVQMMSGDSVGTGLSSAYSALYQGKTTKRAANNLDKLGLIADKSKVTEDKTGQIKFLNPGALKGADLFRQSQFEWVKKILIPTLAEKGLTSKQQIEDAIGSIVSNKVGANLLAKMVDQQGLIDKDEHRNRGAANIDEGKKIVDDTAEGKNLQAKAAFHDARLKVGTTLLPVYTDLLNKATDGLESFNGFAEKHESIVKAGAIAIGGMGAALVTLGPLLVVGGSVLRTYAAWQTWTATQAALARTNILSETAAIEAQGVTATIAGGKMSKFMNLAKGALAVGAAWEIGTAIGTPLGNFLYERNEKTEAGRKKNMNDGRDIAEILAFFGNKDAQRALDNEKYANETNARLAASPTFSRRKAGQKYAAYDGPLLAPSAARQAPAMPAAPAGRSAPSILELPSRPPGKAVPPMPAQPWRFGQPAPGSANGAGAQPPPVLNDNRTYTINVPQVSGQDPKAYAREIRAEIRRLDDVDHRSRLAS